MDLFYISPHLYISFLLIAGTLAFSPGPNALLMVKYGSGHSLKEGIFVLSGIITALITYAILFTLGFYVVISKYPNIISFIYIIGSFYLIYLGSKSIYNFFIKQKYLINESCKTDIVHSLHLCFITGYITAISSPNIILNYSAIVPHFVNYSHNPLPQILILLITHIFLAFISMNIYFILSKKAKIYFKKYAYIQVYISNIFLILIGLYVLFKNLF